MAKFALSIDDNNRILSACVILPKGNYDSMPQVDELPTGETDKEKDVSNYLYVDGEYVYDPLPDPVEPEPEPTQLDMVEAQAIYTAMMTDTLLEV